jgi:hypothetical protein
MRLEPYPSAALQPALADPACHGLALLLEQLVQQAHGDVMDGAIIGVAQALLDEGIDLGQQRAPGPSSASSAWSGSATAALR